MHVSLLLQFMTERRSRLHCVLMVLSFTFLFVERMRNFFLHRVYHLLYAPFSVHIYINKPIVVIIEILLWTFISPQ